MQNLDPLLYTYYKSTVREAEKRFVPKMDNDVVHRIVKLNLHWLSLVRSTISERPAIALSLKR